MAVDTRQAAVGTLVGKVGALTYAIATFGGTGGPAWKLMICLVQDEGAYTLEAGPGVSPRPAA